MHPTLVASLLASVFSGGAVTIVWIIGIILIIAGVVSLFRGSVLLACAAARRECGCLMTSGRRA